jgi:hypothetical protein
METNEQPNPSPELGKLQDELETEAKSLFFAEGEFVVNPTSLTLGILAVFFPKTSLMVSVRVSDGFKEYTVAKTDPTLALLTGSRELISFPTYEQVRAFRRTPEQKEAKAKTDAMHQAAKFLANVSVIKAVETLDVTGIEKAPEEIILYDLYKDDEEITVPNVQAGKEYLALYLANKNQMGQE